MPKRHKSHSVATTNAKPVIAVVSNTQSKDSNNTNPIIAPPVSTSNAQQNTIDSTVYPYYKNIKPPSDIGMSSAGNLSALGRDITGLISYVELLVSGGGKASSTGKPLGNKFFLNTGAECIDTKTNKKVDRYIYINNVPQGNIPILSSGMGVKFREFKGLIPGAISNLNVLNPYSIISSSFSGSYPQCQEITLETIDTNNNISNELHYVSTVDITNMDPCNFANKKNPITNSSCKETFVSSNEKITEIKEIKMPKDVLTQFYFAGLSVLIIYIIFKLMKKVK
jgi:hypothetical protein